MTVAVTHGRSDISAAARGALARRARRNDRLGPLASKALLERLDADDAAALDIDDGAPRRRRARPPVRRPRSRLLLPSPGPSRGIADHQRILVDEHLRHHSARTAAGAGHKGGRLVSKARHQISPPSPPTARLSSLRATGPPSRTWVVLRVTRHSSAVRRNSQRLTETRRIS